MITGDTAGSAREVRDWNDPTRASLATSLAAEIYGLDILAQDVEDEAHNTTRFVVLSKTPAWAAAGTAAPPSRHSCSASATCPPRSTRRSAASPPTAST